MGEDSTLVKLREAGIPREAIGTTLLKEKRTDLRSYITDKRYDEKPIISLVGKDPLPFYLVAKEMSLSGFRVFCCDLVDIHTSLFTDRDESDRLTETLDNVDVVAISGFYLTEGLSSQFLTPYESAYFRSWFVRKINNGTRFILFSDTDISLSTDWYPAAFVRYLSKNCFQFGE